MRRILWDEDTGSRSARRGDGPTIKEDWKEVWREGSRSLQDEERFLLLVHLHLDSSK